VDGSATAACNETEMDGSATAACNETDMDGSATAACNETEMSVARSDGQPEYLGGVIVNDLADLVVGHPGELFRSGFC
jgi:hypothetical protein